jgi:replicative DNA helicase
VRAPPLANAMLQANLAWVHRSGQQRVFHAAPKLGTEEAEVNTEKIDLELAVLIAIASDPYLLNKAVDEGFQPALLQSSPARVLATVLLALREQGVTTIDPLLLKTQVEERGQATLQVVEYLERMTRFPPPQLDQLMAYLELLKDRSSRERLLALASTIQGYASQRDSNGKPIVDFTADALQELLEIQKQRLRKRLTPVGELMRRIARETEERPKGKILLGRSVAPFQRLNEVLSGLRPGFYYGLAGAPRRGKTNLALQLAGSVAANHQIPVLFYSWEQTQRVLTARLIGKESGLNPTSLLTDDLASVADGPERMAKGLSAMHRYGRFLFLVEGNRHDTIERIRASAYNLMHEFRVDSTAIFLDYLQKIPLTNPPSDARARIDEISTGLADLSLELACPVFAISAIDKEGCRLDDEPDGEDRYDELRARPRPTMHNCTGSGDIEYDLDVALILSKDWQATKELEELLRTKYTGGRSHVPKIDIMVLHIDKNRDAPQEAGQAIQYAFFVHENRFVELDYKTEDQDRPDFHQFAKVQEILVFLTRGGHLGPASVGASR